MSMYLKLYSHQVTLNILIMTIFMMNIMSTKDIMLMMDWSLSSSSEFQMSLTLLLDKMSLTFLATVGFVSSAVMTYSKSYMKGEKSSNKFFMTMMMFIMSMMLLASSANLFWLMIGWDGLGLTSFFLIMYFQNWSSLNSAMVTFVSNRIGDLFMIMTMIWMVNIYSLSSFSNSYGATNMNMMIFMSLLIMTAGFSKSAQIPFSAWLPLAMAAPTPVSALVHSSTLVTAGVFLTMRFMPVMNNEMLMKSMMVISCSTMILASMSALWEFDLKKIIALSTLSHIGFMMMFISIGNIQAAMIHMVAHALFKSLLFMCAGVMIHENMNLQDIRQIYMPSTLKNKIFSSLIISIFSMMGIPFMSGFYSKDLMVLSSLEFSMEFFTFIMVMMSALLTCSYSMRLMKFLMSNYSSSFTMFMNEMPALNSMEKSMTIMSVSASVLGSLLVSETASTELLEVSFNEPFMKVMLLIIMLIGMTMGYLIATLESKESMLKIKEMCNKMWFMSYMIIPIQKAFMLNSNNIFNINDTKGWLDYLINESFNKELNNLNKQFNSMLTKTIKPNLIMLMLIIMPSMILVMLN